MCLTRFCWGGSYMGSEDRTNWKRVGQDRPYAFNVSSDCACQAAHWQASHRRSLIFGNRDPRCLWCVLILRIHGVRCAHGWGFPLTACRLSILERERRHRCSVPCTSCPRSRSACWGPAISYPDILLCFALERALQTDPSWRPHLDFARCLSDKHL